MRLRKWVKVTLSAILLALALGIYSKIGLWGELAENNKLYESLTIFGWIWIFTQPFIISIIWED